MIWWKNDCSMVAVSKTTDRRLVSRCCRNCPSWLHPRTNRLGSLSMCMMRLMASNSTAFLAFECCTFLDLGGSCALFRIVSRHSVSRFFTDGSSTRQITSYSAIQRTGQTRGVRKSSLTNLQKISRIHFKKFQMTYAISHIITPEIIVILFQRLPYVQCTQSRLTSENDIANYKIFHKHQLNSRRFPVFPEAISISRSSRSCKYPETSSVQFNSEISCLHTHCSDGRKIVMSAPG